MYLPTTISMEGEREAAAARDVGSPLNEFLRERDAVAQLLGRTRALDRAREGGGVVVALDVSVAHAHAN